MAALNVHDPLILKLTAALRRLWRWRDDGYDVVENDVVVGRILRSPSAPKHRRDVDIQRTRGPAASFWL